MDWKRIEQVIRRTNIPMIVTEGVEEPLIIMPLETYENLLLSQKVHDTQSEVVPPAVVIQQAVAPEEIKPEFNGFLVEKKDENFANISNLSASERLMW